jgi:hypothetical protein
MLVSCNMLRKRLNRLKRLFNFSKNAQNGKQTHQSLTYLINNILKY